MVVLILLCISSHCLALDLLQVDEVDGVLKSGGGWMVEQDEIKILYLAGSPFEIGVQQGLLSMEDPDELLATWLSLTPGYHAEGFDRVLWFFRDLYARFQFVPAFKRYILDEYIDEMKGFIYGASRGEDRDIFDVIMGNAAQDLELSGVACSAFAAWGEATSDGSLYFGRNLDHHRMAAMASFQYLAFYNPQQGYPFVVHNYPAMVGTMSGMNKHGLVITSNYSIPLQTETTVYGTPYMILIREALQYCATITEVIDFLKLAPRTVGLNLMIADKNQAVVVEMTANRMIVREGEHYIFTTNQFIDEYMKDFQGDLWLASSLRDQRFEELIQNNYGSIDEKKAIEFMRDKYEPGTSANLGFVGGINSESTMASIVFVPAKQQIYLAVPNQFDTQAPFAADGQFVGIDCGAIWASAQPQPSLAVIEKTEATAFNQDWFTFSDARYLWNNGQYLEALTLTTSILEKYPQGEMPLYLAGRLSIHLNRLAEGLEYLQKFISLEEHNEPFYLYLGKVWAAVILDTKGLRAEAIELYQKALAVEIDDLPGQFTGFRQIAAVGIDYPLLVDEKGVISRQ